MIKNNLKYGWFVACILFLMANLTSCNDDGGSGSAPEIQQVQIVRVDSINNPFLMAEQAHTGSTILISGRNLQNAQKVFINDQELFFNAVFNTATNIFVNIPTEENGFILTYIDPELKPEIRVETDHGTATYLFKVLYNNPSVSMIDAENYPCETGEKIVVTGENFVDVKRVYFTNINPNPKTGEEIIDEPEVIVEVPHFDVENNRYMGMREGSKTYITESEMTFSLPVLPRIDGNYFGYLTIECAASAASMKFATLPAPIISGLSSNMPIPGTEFTISGLYFLEAKVNINDGEIIILPEEMTQVSRTSLSFIMPAKPTKRCTLRVEAINGDAEYENFYPYENLIIDFDDINFGWTWGEGFTFTDFKGEYKPDQLPYITDGRCVGISGRCGSNNWWWKQIVIANFEKYPSFDVIPAETPLTKLKLVYECFVEKPTNISVQYRFPVDDADGKGPNIPFTDDGTRVFGKWAPVSITIADICNVSSTTTYGDLVGRPATEHRSVMWGFINTSSAEAEIAVFVDNARLEVVE